MWLNVVLNINRILYHCMEKKAATKMPFVNSMQQGIHSSMISTIIGLKAVFTRPGLHEFWYEISKFAAKLIIWSSIKRSIAKEIVHYLFRGLAQPFEVHGQDN